MIAFFVVLITAVWWKNIPIAFGSRTWFWKSPPRRTFNIGPNIPMLYDQDVNFGDTPWLPQQQKS